MKSSQELLREARTLVAMLTSFVAGHEEMDTDSMRRITLFHDDVRAKLTTQDRAARLGYCDTPAGNHGAHPKRPECVNWTPEKAAEPSQPEGMERSK